MDSMRSLNTSLPSSASAQPPEQLLQAFKSAALSVTNLYKTASSDQANARHLGYQEALEDIRAFLDREKLALDDGDGTTIRRWVVNRIDGTGTTTTTTSDSEDETQTDKRRSTSPTMTTTRKESPDTTNRSRRSPSGQPHTSTSSSTPSTSESRPTFTFSAGPQYPAAFSQDTDMRSPDSASSTSNDSTTHLPPTSSPAVRLEVIPRGPRTPHRGNPRHRTRSSTRDPTTGSGTGSKRKFHFPDFFDVSNMGNGRDGFGGGGKRGRFI